MRKAYKKLMAYGLGALLLVSLFGYTAASFTDSSKVSGATFTVGSSDIKLLSILSGGTSSGNLVDEMPGPSFNNISPNWSEDYLVKIYNSSTSTIALTSAADYQTANDPDNIREEIFVEPIYWDDVDGNGIVDTGELGTSLGKKTIIKWKTEGYDLGQISPADTKGLLLRFSTATIPSSKQGATAYFDFVFDSISL